MIAEVYIGMGNPDTVWDNFIEHVFKKYNIDEVKLEELKKYKIISLSTELFEVTVQKEKDMIGVIINPPTVTDYNPLLMYVISGNEELLQGILRNDQTVINSLYTTFLAILDEDGDMDMEIYTDDKVESEFWSYVNIFDELAFNMLKINVFNIIESQVVNNSKIKLKDNKMLSIVKAGSFYPLIESLKLTVSGKKNVDERGYL